MTTSGVAASGMIAGQVQLPKDKVYTAAQRLNSTKWTIDRRRPDGVTKPGTGKRVANLDYE